MSTTTPAPSIANLEGNDDYHVYWAWEREKLAGGMTSVLRVKNEARSLPWVLPPLFSATQQVILVDNQSTDGTIEVAKETADKAGAADRLIVKEYPFDVSKCGSEHLHTPARSVHSLTHFYNWSFSHVQTAYSLKWDGDMVLTREGAATFADLSWQLPSAGDSIVSMPRHPLFVESDRVAYLDVALKNVERWVYPMGPEYQFEKAFEWELRVFPDSVDRLRLPEGLCVELKYLDSNEFDHWTEEDFFSGSSRNERKRREWTVFNELGKGNWRDIDGIQRIEAPEGVHVIDYVTDVWLPRAPRPLTTAAWS